LETPVGGLGAGVSKMRPQPPIYVIVGELDRLFSRGRRSGRERLRVSKMVIGQDKRTNRHSVIVTLLAWGLISALLFGRLWGLTEVSFMIACALIAGFVVTFIVVLLPFRVLQNVTQPERRRARIQESVLCILTFLALVNLVYSLIVSYPSDW
jgi:hypothetical protein